MFISAFNEEKGIEKKIRNLLEQDYQGSYAIVVASDGSTDRTADIVRSFNEPRIVLHDFKKNRGKAAMQNEIVPVLSCDVVIFSDATCVWPKDAMGNIVRNFADPAVGCVAVDLCFVSERDGVVEKGQGAYWKYERFLRRYGALVKTNIVASGTTYAIRKSLFRPIRSDIAEDLSNPLQIAMAGQRVVFDPEVIIEERSSSTHASEIRMRKRIAVRNVTGLVSYVKYLNPRYGFAAYQSVCAQVSPGILLGTDADRADCQLCFGARFRRISLSVPYAECDIWPCVRRICEDKDRYKEITGHRSALLLRAS